MARSLEPQKIGVHDWYYEEKRHLLLVHERRDEFGRHLGTDQIKIPWRMIEASMKRRRA